MKKRLLLAAAALYFLPILTFSQAIEWQNTIGGNDFDRLNSIKQTADGGYILGGSSNSNISIDKTENCKGGADFWIVKTDSLGVIQWQNTIGGNNTDELNSIKQTVDGGYILGGRSASNMSADKNEHCKGVTDFWIIKTDALGVIQWQNTIGGSSADELYDIQQTTDGGFILGGYSDSGISGDKTEFSNGGYDFWIVKTDASGVIQWQNTIGGLSNDLLYSIQQTTDGGYILGGYSQSNISGDKTENCHGGWDYWIVKTDTAGAIQWQNTIGGNNYDKLYSIQQTTDGGYVLGGFSWSNISGDKTENCIGQNDFWIVKTDTSGTILWQNTIGGSDYDELYSMEQTPDDGYILGGWSSSNISGDKTENSNGYKDYWIVKTNASGVIQWQNTIGGAVDDELYSIQQTNDGGCILGGRSISSISGDKTENGIGNFDYWMVKIIAQPNSILEITASPENLLLYPNPAKTTLTIENENLQTLGCRINITDVAGRTIFSKSITTTSSKHNIDISSFSQGIYFVQLQAGDKISRGRFVKE